MLTSSDNHFFRFRSQLHKKLTVTVVGTLVILLMGVVLPVLAGDSIYGKVTEVRSANLVTLDNGSIRVEIRIVGIAVPRDRANAERAMEMVRSLVLGKNARVRVESRRRSGEMIGRLFTDDEDGIKDVGVELVRAGLARRQQGRDEQFGYKYNELTIAERAARRARSGVWAR